MKTLREKFIEALIALGESKVEETSKHIKFTRSGYVPAQFYFIGKSGSLRVGINKVTSIPLSINAKSKLIDKAIQLR